MTAPDELQRAVERLSEMTDWTARGNPGSEVSVMMASNVLRLLLSERAELLATVERMRGALEEAADSFARIKDYVGGRNIDFASAFVRADRGEKHARAALTTGEANHKDKT